MWGTWGRRWVRRDGSGRGNPGREAVFHMPSTFGAGTHQEALARSRMDRESSWTCR